MMKDYYAILEIPETADAQEIKKAYRNLAKKYHPDTVRDDSVKMQRMYAIQEAYECLGNEESRKRYDESRRKQAASMKNGAVYPNGRTMAAGRGKSPQKGASPDKGQFERFFGFSPGKGMETYQAQKAGNSSQQGPICPDEMFAQFFGSLHGRKGGNRR